MQLGFKIFGPLKNIYKYKKLEDKAVQSSNLDWTIIRLPLLTDKPATGYKIYPDGYKCGPLEIPRISRRTVDKFYLENLENNQLIHKCPVVL